LPSARLRPPQCNSASTRGPEGLGSPSLPAFWRGMRAVHARLRDSRWLGTRNPARPAIDAERPPRRADHDDHALGVTDGASQSHVRSFTRGLKRRGRSAPVAPRLRGLSSHLWPPTSALVSAVGPKVDHGQSSTGMTGCSGSGSYRTPHTVGRHRWSRSDAAPGQTEAPPPSGLSSSVFRASVGPRPKNDPGNTSDLEGTVALSEAGRGEPICLLKAIRSPGPVLRTRRQAERQAPRRCRDRRSPCGGSGRTRGRLR
jgi:hypothetical protein